MSELKVKLEEELEARKNDMTEARTQFGQNQQAQQALQQQAQVLIDKIKNLDGAIQQLNRILTPQPEVSQGDSNAEIEKTPGA